MQQINPPPLRKRGFTLIELAIVLGVMGLLIAGLFQLTSSSAQQVRDQLTAQQIQQYLRAARAYLITANVDATGNLNAVGPIGAVATVVGSSYDITANVRTFRNNSLATTAPNGGGYVVVLRRENDAAGQPLFLVLVAQTGGTASNLTSVGNTAGFVGAEGVGVYAPIAGVPDNAGTALCDEGGQNTIRGPLGAICYNASAFAAAVLDTPRAGGLAVFSANDLTTASTPYLWRDPSPFGGLYNRMNTTLTMAGANAIALNGGVVRDDSGAQLNIGDSINMSSAALAERNINTNGGQVNTANGNINTGGGVVNTGGGSIATNGGDIATSNGQINAGGGAVNGGTGTFGTLNAVSFIYTSDRSLKNHITPLQNPLDRVLQLRGVEYEWKQNGKHDIGLVADEVAKVYPELVSTIKNNDGQEVQAIQLANLIAPVIESIKVLAAENTALKERIKLLEQSKGALHVKE